MRKHVEEISELKNIKTQKFGILIKKRLEDYLRSLEKLKSKEKMKDKFEKESKSLRDMINDLIDLQDENKKISEDNLEILQSNIETETKNILVCNKNKEYLTDLYRKLNDL